MIKIIFYVFVFLIPVVSYAHPIKLHTIKDDYCLNCFFISNSPVNEGFRIEKKETKELIYGKYYKDYLLEFGGKFYYLYRVELSNVDGRDYVGLKVISVGGVSNVKVVSFFDLAPSELFDNYGKHEGREIVFSRWLNKDTFKLKVGNTNYIVKLFFKVEHGKACVFAALQVPEKSEPNQDPENVILSF